MKFKLFFYTIIYIVVLVYHTEVLALTPKEKITLDEINEYLNDNYSFSGNFEQIDFEGKITGGKFYILRPGRLRFEYNKPSNLTVTSDNYFVVIHDKKFDTFNRYPLGSTPLSIILKKKINIEKNAQIESLKTNQKTIVLKLSKKVDEGESPYILDLVFLKEPITLVQWAITDLENKRTIIKLDKIVNNENIDPKLFISEDMIKEKKNKNNND